MNSYVRISALLWADILVAYALFVMQNYLTNVWKISFIHSAGILNIWGGISMILPVFFLFLVDAFVGNFTMLVVSSITYSVGIGLVTMSTPPVLSKKCEKYEPQCIGRPQKILFYTGMALIAVGVAGNLVSVKPFLEEQKPDTKDTEARGEKKVLRECLKIPAFILVVFIPIVGAVALPYIKPWTLRFGIPAICTLVATLMFLSGSCTYVKVKPKGSPITRVCRVFVAAFHKKSEPFPLDSEVLYKGDEDEGSQSFSRTRFLRGLEKAAITLEDTIPEDERKRWRLSSVTEVEAAKIAVRMIPMWTTFVICGIVSSVGNTYFIEQANKMDRKIGSWKLPLQILLLLQQWMKNLVLAPLAKRVLKKHPTYGAPVGIACAMVFSILCCVTAALVEIRRIGVIKRHGLLDKPEDSIPMSVFWLLFQFFLLAGLDSFFEKSVGAFYNGQSPKCMRNYLQYFTKGVSGLGFMCSVLMVHVVGEVSEKGGRKNWFQFTLNRSRLDRYYWVLAVLSGANLVVFGLVASQYTYRDTKADDGEGFGPEGRGEGPAPAEIEDKQCCYCFF